MAGGSSADLNQDLSWTGYGGGHENAAWVAELGSGAHRWKQGFMPDSRNS
jgi:hypothetical protein